jgi:acyl-CoA reductase-like NAD-dependent aldehyde dehydrogenase
MKEYKLLIGGKLVRGAAVMDVINPATEATITACPCADASQLNEAVAAARNAFPAWSSTTLEQRGELLKKLSAALSARQDEFARILTLEQGKPLPGAAFEVAGSSLLIQYFASQGLADTVLRESDHEKIIKQRAPLGVVAAIAAWNFPLLLLVIKVAPALLAGNTVVAKPAPTTPLTTLLFGELCAEIFPPGVVNIIADRNDLGGLLTSHPDVAKVAFTGSTETGKKVMASASATLKRLTLELGGNDAAIVLDDVDPKTVAPALFAGAMLNSGQLCIASKRVYVHESQYDVVCEELAKCANAAVVDDGMIEGAQFGPVQNRRQYDKLLGYIDEARQRGRILAGGRKLDRKGYFIPPTIVRDLPDDARLVTEEQFGPVLPVLRYADVNDAIRRANACELGLGAIVWSSDWNRALRVASQLQCGSVYVNKNPDLQPDVPLGGTKRSGFGFELGREGLEEFTHSRIISIAKRPPIAAA